MTITFEQFKAAVELNNRLKKDEVSVVAKRLGVEIDLIKDYRKRLKEEKKSSLCSEDELKDVPSIEQLEAVSYRQEVIKPQAPVSASGYIVSSFKTAKDGSIAEVWQKIDENSFPDETLYS